MNREKRKVLAQETLDITNKGYYEVNGVIINIQNELEYSKHNTKVYTSEKLEKNISKINLAHSYSTSFEVVDEDVVTCIQRVSNKENDEVMCLNFASAKNAGGGFLNGSIAQEESLAFSSNLYECQIHTKGYYDLHRNMKSCVYSDTMIYSPKVTFFRNHDGSLNTNPTFCNIITSAAVNKGVVINREQLNSDEINEIMLRRIDKLLSLASYQNNKVLILGAWGCGVFKNEPIDIAHMFSMLLKNKYEGVFKRVVFAIYSKNKNFIKAFDKEFSLPEKRKKLI